MKNKMLSSFVLLLLGGHISQAQTVDTSKVSQLLTLLEKNEKFMGTVALSKDRKLVYSRTIGYADIDKKEKANKETLYRIGSITKTFTATLVLKAVEEGKLRLDQTLDDYFPKIQNAKKITIAQLLGHQSGIKNLTDEPAYMSYYTKAHTFRDLVDTISHLKSDFEPGTQAAYSNSNYILLSMIVEKAFRMPFSDILASYITSPLNLKHTYYGAGAAEELISTASYSYWGKWKQEPATDLSVPLGAGAIVSNATDLVIFSQALFGGKLLSQEMMEKMKTIEKGYGMGLFSLPYNSEKGFGHTGGIDGFSSIFSHFDNGNIDLAVISNGGNFSANDVGLALLHAAYGDDYELPKISNFKLDPNQLKEYIGTYASKQMPLKINISIEGAALKAQATGQSAFPLEPTEPRVFEFSAAGIKLEFNAGGKGFTLHQGGQAYLFEKD